MERIIATYCTITFTVTWTIAFGIYWIYTNLVMFSPVLFFILGLFIYRIIKARWFGFGAYYLNNLSTASNMIVWILPLFTYSIFEEIGWRGFLLPHFQEKYNALTSTIYLTLIWAAWHIPFFLYRFDFSIFISIGFFLGITIGAIILTSIYNSNKGLLIPVMIFHFLNNLCSEFDKEIIVAVLSTGFVFIAIHIYKTLGKLNLSEIERTKNYLKDS